MKAISTRRTEAIFSIQDKATEMAEESVTLYIKEVFPNAEDVEVDFNLLDCNSMHTAELKINHLEWLISTIVAKIEYCGHSKSDVASIIVGQARSVDAVMNDGEEYTAYGTLK